MFVFVGIIASVKGYEIKCIMDSFMNNSYSVC